MNQKKRRANPIVALVKKLFILAFKKFIGSWKTSYCNNVSKEPAKKPIVFIAKKKIFTSFIFVESNVYPSEISRAKVE